MNNVTPRLKPLALILAMTFPLFAQAASNVSASGQFQITPLPYNYWITAQSGILTQAATSGAFNNVVTGTPSSSYDSNVSLTATSDGSGHFGSAIENTVPWNEYSPQTASTQVILSDAITNNTGSTQNVSFSFNISSLMIDFRTGMGIGPENGSGVRTDINLASFAANIFVNGQSVWNSSFSASSSNPNWNGIVISTTSTGSDIGLASAAGAINCRDFQATGCDFSISNFQQTLNLGPLAANASLAVTYEVNLHTETNTYGGSPSIYFNDPASIAAGNIGASAPISASLQFATAVPEPEQASMLLAGLALIGAAAKRRRKSR